MRAIIKISLIFLLLGAVFCQQQPTRVSTQDDEKVDIAFKIQIPDEVKLQVHSAVARVTAPDMDTIRTELFVTPTHVEGIIRHVPAGRKRFFEIFVFDQDSVLTFYGSKYADVFAGFMTRVEIMLQPVGDDGTVLIIGYFSPPHLEKIVYSTFDSRPPYDDGEIFMMNPDGSDKVQLTQNPGADYHPNISPSGDKIAFVRNLDPDGINTHIFIMNVDGTEQKQLTFPPVREDSPWFSPDGDQIVFRKTMETGASDICVVNSDGTGFRNLTRGQIGALHPTWGYDNCIYFVTHGSDYKIWKIRPDGSELSVVSPFKIGAHERVQFTRDMKHIFYDSHQYPNQIVKSDFPAFLNSRTITSGDDTGGFCLSPDEGKMIFSQGSHENGYFLFIKDFVTGRIEPLGIRAIHSDWEPIVR